MNKKTEKIRRTICELKDQGMSLKEIAVHLDTEPKYILHHLKAISGESRGDTWACGHELLRRRWNMAGTQGVVW